MQFKCMYRGVLMEENGQNVELCSYVPWSSLVCALVSFLLLNRLHSSQSSVKGLWNVFWKEGKKPFFFRYEPISDASTQPPCGIELYSSRTLKWIKVLALQCPTYNTSCCVNAWDKGSDLKHFEPKHPTGSTKEASVQTETEQAFLGLLMPVISSES